MTTICEEVARTIPVDCHNEAMPRPRFTVPRVEFITERRRGLTPAQVAYGLTGRNIMTGELTLGVGIRNKRSGMTRFQCDLWKLPFDFHPNALSRLAGRWQRENAAMPNRILRRMEQYFCGRTSFMFDVMSERVCDWRKFLGKLLTDRNSFVSLVQGCVDV